jgi:hypothetical protein
MTGWLRLGMTALLIAPISAMRLDAQAKPLGADKAAEAREDSAARVFLEEDERFFERRLQQQRALYLKGAEWAELGDRCHPGALRVFPKDTSAEQRDSLQRLVENMERTIIARGVGSRLDTPAAAALLRTIVGWEAGIDRPLWDVDTKESREAFATGLLGDVPDPRGPGCLPSPMAVDTVTFVIPGFASMAFPKAPRPRIRAYFGPEAQQHVRNEFFADRGQKDLQAELSYIVVAPIVIWRGWALVGVDRPREKGGIEIGQASNGGAVYLLRQVGSQWRLTTVVRTWGS